MLGQQLNTGDAAKCLADLNHYMSLKDENLRPGYKLLH